MNRISKLTLLSQSLGESYGNIENEFEMQIEERKKFAEKINCLLGAQFHVDFAITERDNG